MAGRWPGRCCSIIDMVEKVSGSDRLVGQMADLSVVGGEAG
jgi:hypothetical protein